MSPFKKIKTFIKLNYPTLTRNLINLRDNNKLIRVLKRKFFIKLAKNVHGKKIIKSEKGFIIDFSLSNYVSYVVRPKKAKNIITNIENYEYPSTAIIIRGSIYGLEEFVEETIYIYKKLFQNTQIILSIWEDEVDNKFLKKFDTEENIKIILNKGIYSKFSPDFQTHTASSALLYAEEQKIKYCVNTRTDSRIYKKNSISFLNNLLKNYPIHQDYQFLKNRIISCSIDTRKYRIYGLSDIFLFGSTENLKKYFNKTSFIDSLQEMNLGSYPCIKNDTAIINEIFLFARYFYKNNIELQWTLEDWWKKCRELFIIVDPSSLDFFWYKYEWKYEQRFNTNYSSNFEQSIQYSDWLNLYMNDDFKFNESLKEKWKIQDGLLVQ